MQSPAIQNRKGQSELFAPWVDKVIWMLGVMSFTITGLYLILKGTMIGLEVLIDMLVEFKRAGNSLVENMRRDIDELINHLKK